MDKERNSHKHTEGTASAPLLSIRGLSAAYDGRTVLHDVNLEVYERDFLGIIGPNGGGKTTLIKCILGLLRPTGGEIVKHHEPLTTGYLPQYSSIDRSFPISVLEVILSGLSSKKSLISRFDDHQREKARQVMKSPCSRKSKLAGCIKKCRMGFFQYLFCILNIQILQETLRRCSRPLAKHPLEMEGTHIDMFCDLLQFRLRTIVLFNKADSICNPIIIQFLL